MSKITNYIVSTALTIWVGIKEAHSQTPDIQVSDNCKVATLNAWVMEYPLPEVFVCKTANTVKVIILWKEYTWDASLFECLNNELKKSKTTNDTSTVFHTQADSIKRITLVMKEAAEGACKK